jgi:uncharacterized protein Veg
LQTLQQIRGGIKQNLGRRVFVKSHRGRIKSVENEGVLESVYQSVFTILVVQDGITRRQSYAYSDLFTKHLELKWMD